MAEHHPLGDIEYLRDNHLQHYKPGFPILKELIQNAEDSCSTHFEYGWLDGIPDAEHDLLKSPALFILDNGEFQEKNAKSIRFILGGSSKLSERDAIGKFGLGLKSVFHLCEAFFYIAPQLKYGKFDGYDIFNPWATNDIDDYHANWDNFSKEDRNKILRKLHPILQLPEYRKNWFILWIPLRQKTHQTLKKEEDGISLGWIKEKTEDFFESEPKFLHSYETQKNLSLLLPLMHCLTHIRYWHSALEQAVFNIQFNAGVRRHQAISQILCNQPIDLGGNIIASNTPCFEFTGRETVFASEGFQQVLDNFNSLGKFKNIRPHAIINFSRWTSIEEKVEFLIRTAVFLPIGKDWKESISSQFNYCLTLHGYFFIDSARTGILGWDEKALRVSVEKTKAGDSNILQEKWNLLLYDYLLADLLIVFAKFVFDDKNYKLPDKEIDVICDLLLNSPLFVSENRKSVCKKNQWVFRTQPSFNRWELIGLNEIVRSLPSIPPNWDAFPELSKFAKHNYLILSTKPNLLAEQTSLAWQTQEICEILDSLESSSIFLNLDNLSYLKTFLNKQKKAVSQLEVQVSLRKLLQQAFLKLGMEALQQEKLLPHVQELVALLSQERRYTITKGYKNEQAARSILSKLYALNLELLLVHKTFETSSHLKNGKLNFEQLVAVLNCLSEVLITEASSQKLSHEIIQQVLGDFESPKTVLITLKNTSLFLGYNHREEITNVYTYSQLEAFRRQGYLFKGTDKTEIATALREALPDCNLIFIDASLAEFLNRIPSLKGISICDQTSCLQLFTSKPKLATPERRINLLQELINNV